MVHFFILLVGPSFFVSTPLMFLAAWRVAVLGRTPVPVTMVDGLRTLEIADACYRSAAAEGARVAVALGPRR